MYAPYLPLEKRVELGEWELIPRADLRDSDALDAEAATLARGFAGLHTLPHRFRDDRVGAFARPMTSRVGDEPTSLEQLPNLQRALVVAVLDDHESPLRPEEDQDPNLGHKMMTADNALVRCIGVARSGGWTANISGGRVRSYEMGLSVYPEKNVGRQPQIAPPGDLRIPSWWIPIDFEYATAALESIQRGTDEARRLGRAIDWLGIAATNSMGVDVRIPALKVGFEALLDDDDYLRLAAKLSALLDASGVDKQRRTWPSRDGARVLSGSLSELGWWFINFTFLRNNLLHGRVPLDDDWVWANVAHVVLGDWWLRQAIKKRVEQDGHPDIDLEPTWRDAYRSLRSRLGEEA